MVFKDDIYVWFKHLDGHKRIDFMCGLLHMCLPCEQRFLGCVVEDLGKRDYHYLREAEIRSNNPTELEKLINLNIKTTRSRINVALALLHSYNTECANVLFKILTCASSDGVMEHLLSEDHGAEELLLLLTMAANHPAFTIDQRLVLCDILLKCQRLAEPEPQEIHLCSLEDSSLPQERAFIQDILVKGFHRRVSDKKYELHMQVTWSDDTVTEIKKTHQELYDFHAKLIKLFPEEAGAHRQDRQIPFLCSFKRQCNNKEDFEAYILPNVCDYTRRLVRLPHRLLECDHVQDFFSGGDISPVPPGRPSEEEEDYDVESPRQIHSLTDDGYSPNGCLQSFTVYNSNMIQPHHHHHHPHDHPDILMHVKQQTVINSVSTVTTNHRHMYTCNQVSPSPHNSPLPSPLSSPHISPSNQHGSRPSSPSSKHLPDDIPTWLKQLRLHKYSGQLSKYTIDELLQLGDKELEHEGLTCGARKKLLGEIEKCKRVLSNMNGVVQDSDSCNMCTTPPSPTATWHTPPTNRSYLPIPHTQINSSAASYQSNPSSGETSPSCSEYSSPSASPVPSRRTSRQMDSSDENEKDAHHAPVVPESRPDLMHLRGYPYIIPYAESHANFHKQMMDMHIANNHPMMSRMVRDTQMVAMQPCLPREDVKPPMEGISHVVNSHGGGYTSEPMPMIPGGYQIRPTIPSPRPQFKPLPLVTPNGPYPIMPKNVVDNNSNSTSPVPPALRQTVPEMYSIPTPPHNMTVPMVPIANIPIDNLNKQYMSLHDTNSIPRPNSQPNNADPQPPIVPPGQMNSYNGPVNLSVPLVTDNNLNNKGSGASTPNSLVYPMPVYHTSVNTPTTTTTFSVPYSPTQPPTPSHTPTSQTNSCSVCGCSGDCSVTSSSTTAATPTTPVSYFRFPNLPPQMGSGMYQHLPPGTYLPPTSNGMINPLQNIPFQPLHSMNYPNGLTPELMYSTTPFAVVGGHPAIPSHLLTHMQGMPFLAPCQPTSQAGNNVTKPMKVISCYNCGQNGHRATDCKEATMDSITHTGHYHMNFRPKSDLEDNR